MARWEAILTVMIGLGIGLAIAATALLPLSHALTGGYRPYVPGRELVAILGPLAVLALLGFALNDSGIRTPGVMLGVVIPVMVVILLRANRDDEQSRSPVRGETA